jgi:decaprenyl-phosphate phosphoribosyltransferase
MPVTASPAAAPLRILVEAMRPQQWAKNLLGALAPVAAGMLWDPQVVGRTVAMVVLYCLASSGLYLHNDVRDRADDIRDPRTAGQLPPVDSTSPGHSSPRCC